MVSGNPLFMFQFTIMQRRQNIKQEIAIENRIDQRMNATLLFMLTLVTSSIDWKFAVHESNQCYNVILILWIFIANKTMKCIVFLSFICVCWFMGSMWLLLVLSIFYLGIGKIVILTLFAKKKIRCQNKNIV